MNFKSLIPHSIVVAIFLVLSFLYCKPVLDHKILLQHDMVQASGAAQEATQFKKETGRMPLWTNSMFGGMPTYTIKGEFPKSYTSRLSSYLTYILPLPVNLIFWMLVGAYIMLIVLGFDPWLSAIGAVGFAFASYNIIIIQAGHVSKVVAVAYCPPLVAGIVLLYRGRFLLGALVTSFFAMMELYANHIQITYYLLIGIGVLVLYYLLISIKEKKILQFIYASMIALSIGILCIGSMASRFWTTYEYTKYSTRGPSELKSSSAQAKIGGLDRDYAYSWSYGIVETFTYIIPNFYGGSSEGKLNEKSNVYTTMVENGVPKSAAKDFVQNIGGYGGQLYWGEQSSTSGPAYMGAIFCFLFLLGMLVIQDKIKWWILGVIVLFSMMAWGKNLEWFNYFLFDHFPLYNKFRAVTMIHALVSIFIVWVGIWGTKEILSGKLTNEEIEKKLKISTGVFSAIFILFLLIGSSVMDFQKISETVDATGKIAQTSDDYFKSVLMQVTQNEKLSEDIFQSFIEDRISLFKMDALRSLVLVLLAAITIWLFVRKKINYQLLLSITAVLVLFDMWAVCKRYLNDEDFKNERKALETFEPTPADLEILKDTDANYRVFNASVSTFNDATTSYFHKSVGGYSGAKMKRVQDVIEQHISNNNMAVLNMLNTKYFIVQQQKNTAPVAQRNPDALGNAWFVQNINWVNSPDEEIAGLKGLNPKTTAVVNVQYKDALKSINVRGTDSLANIQLTSYAPDDLVYQSKTTSPQLAVFSEIYYNSGLGWNAYIDGVPTNHIRVNYILRGLNVPAGNHKIEFKFEPRSYILGENISMLCSIILFIGVGLIGVVEVKKNKQSNIE